MPWVVGAYVTEALRKRYPDAVLINVAVWPFSAGEVCVQHYNAVLSLASLTKVRTGWFRLFAFVLRLNGCLCCMSGVRLCIVTGE